METNVQTSTGTQAPDHKHLNFEYNPQTRYYQMTKGEIGFLKVPNELKLEETQKKELIQSDFIIRSRIKDGKYQFFTGLLKTNFENWYFGDHFEVRHGIKKNSFILFHFTPDHTTLEIFYFNHFKLYPKRRGAFIREFITNLKR